jgi:hypothetical protein
MEHLFSPCSRLFDYVENRDVPGDDWDDTETIKEINLDVSTQELLSAERGFTYADLYAVLGDEETVAWLTPNVLITCASGRAGDFSNQLIEDGYCACHFIADGKGVVATARSSDSSQICDVVLRLMAVSGIRSIFINSCTDVGAFINAPSLEYLMEKCQRLKFLSLSLELDEDHCHVLGGYSRPDLEIELTHCKLTSAGTRALSEVLGYNQGPTKLDLCDIDNLVLADGLRGNSRLTSLRPAMSSNLVLYNREVLEYTHALLENRGLVDLNVYSFMMSDETWGAVCHSLKTHPTLQVLDLHTPTFEPSVCSAAMAARISALLGMLKVNTVIHTIHLHSRYSEHELFRALVTPYLETNRLRPRLLAIQKTLPIAYRAKVLGRALLAVRTDPNRFWMLLSGNAEVAFPSTTTTATTTPAANLPAPATVGASANAAIGAANSVATGPPVANVVAGASGQKRKACPESQPEINN